MGTARTFIWGVAILAASSGARATSYSIAGIARPAMTYTTPAGVTAGLTSGYSGVGGVFITTTGTAPGHGYVCSGALLNATTVLTAAHCLYDHNEETGVAEALTSVSFYLPSFGERHDPTVQSFAATSYEYNPLYDNATDLPDGTPAHTGDIGSGHDVALFTLAQAATGFSTYSLYTGDPFQEYTEVGNGSVGGPMGTGTGGVASPSDFLKRVGHNMFEAYGSDIFSDVTEGVVLSDFDDGTAAHDVFGFLTNYGYNQEGVPGGDADSSPGDSGGPEFINGQIAAVTSFGITAGIFNATKEFPDGFCGEGSLDPYGAGGSTKPISVDSGTCTNSSVGELAGDTLTSYNLDFINAYLGGNGHATLLPTPEPATWAEMLLGFGLLGGSVRSSCKKACA